MTIIYVCGIHSGQDGPHVYRGHMGLYARPEVYTWRGWVDRGELPPGWETGIWKRKYRDALSFEVYEPLEMPDYNMEVDHDWLNYEHIRPGVVATVNSFAVVSRPIEEVLANATYVSWINTVTLDGCMPFILGPVLEMRAAEVYKDYAGVGWRFTISGFLRGQYVPDLSGSRLFVNNMVWLERRDRGELSSRSLSFSGSIPFDLNYLYGAYDLFQRNGPFGPVEHPYLQYVVQRHGAQLAGQLIWLTSADASEIKVRYDIRMRIDTSNPILMVEINATVGVAVGRFTWYELSKEQKLALSIILSTQIPQIIGERGPSYGTPYKIILSKLRDTYEVPGSYGTSGPKYFVDYPASITSTNCMNRFAKLKHTMLLPTHELEFVWVSDDPIDIKPGEIVLFEGDKFRIEEISLKNGIWVYRAKRYVNTNVRLSNEMETAITLKNSVVPGRAAGWKFVGPHGSTLDIPEPQLLSTSADVAKRWWIT